MKKAKSFFDFSNFDIDDAFNYVFNSEIALSNTDKMYKYKDEDFIVYELEVPGFNKDNIVIETSNGQLTINGERSDYHENSVGDKTISKSVKLNNHRVEGAIIADGILTIRFVEDKKDAVKVEVK
jgi:HSP20 family molecular chaperone IbpA